MNLTFFQCLKFYCLVFLSWFKSSWSWLLIFSLFYKYLLDKVTWNFSMFHYFQNSSSRQSFLSLHLQISDWIPRVRLVNVFKNWKLLFKNFCRNTWGEKICEMLFKNWKLLFGNTHQTPPEHLRLRGKHY